MADIFKETLKKRERDAGLDDAPAQDPKKGINKGDLPMPGMSQADFSGYPDDKKKSGPPADMLKKRASKD